FVYLLWSRYRLLRDWRAWIAAALALEPGLLFYLYVPWRGASSPVYQPFPVDSLDHFLDLVLARNLSDMLTAVTWQQVPQRLGWSRAIAWHSPRTSCVECASLEGPKRGPRQLRGSAMEPG